MASTLSWARVEALHAATMACLDAMIRLHRKQVKPTDPEPEALADLRRAVQALPEASEEPFLGTNVADLSPDGTSWHRTVWVRARDWAQRLTANLDDPRWRKLGQVQGMPGLDLEPERFRNYLRVEMNRARKEQDSADAVPVESAEKLESDKIVDKAKVSQERRPRNLQELKAIRRKVDRGLKKGTSQQESVREHVEERYPKLQTEQAIRAKANALIRYLSRYKDLLG